MYNDRIAGGEDFGILPKPQVEIIVDGNRIFKPGMKTVFVENDTEVSIGSKPVILGGEYCSCNTVAVCTCNAVCTCQAVCTCESVCQCVGYVACSCEQYCTCDQVCSCENVCSCVNHTSGSGGTCAGPCLCVPVH